MTLPDDVFSVYIGRDAHNRQMVTVRLVHPHYPTSMSGAHGSGPTYEAAYAAALNMRAQLDTLLPNRAA